MLLAQTKLSLGKLKEAKEEFEGLFLGCACQFQHGQVQTGRMWEQNSKFCFAKMVAYVDLSGLEPSKTPQVQEFVGDPPSSYPWPREPSVEISLPRHGHQCGGSVRLVQLPRNEDGQGMDQPWRYQRDHPKWSWFVGKLTLGVHHIWKYQCSPRKYIAAWGWMPYWCLGIIGNSGGKVLRRSLHHQWLLMAGHAARVLASGCLKSGVFRPLLFDTPAFLGGNTKENQQIDPLQYAEAWQHGLYVDPLTVGYHRLPSHQSVGSH